MEIAELVNSLRQSIASINAERQQDNAPPLDRIEIRILGQMSLLLDEAAVAALSPVATFDFDVVIKGGWIARRILKEILSEHRLELDDLSSEIWMPPETKYISVHHSDSLLVERSEPLYTLVSKAIMAPAKNRFLIKRALAVYGEPLRRLIIQHGGSIKLFE